MSIPETIDDAIARNTTAEALAKRAAEIRASRIAARRRNAAEALRAIGHATDVRLCEGIARPAPHTALDQVTLLGIIERVRDGHPDRGPDAQRALDALCALLAVL